MSIRTVTTQAEFDEALREGVDRIDIRSERYVWIEVTATESATVRATGSANVRAYGSANVTATGSANVRAYESANVTATGAANVRAYESATVRATDSVNVRAYDSANVIATGAATVIATDSATVRATDSVNVRAYDSANVIATGAATVIATDSATVRATDSVNVRAYESANVTATDSATVRAYGSATVRATPRVAVQLFSPTAQVVGGVIIDAHTLITDPTEWCDHHGVTVSKAGVATVFKAVDDTYLSPHGTSYKPGTKPSAPDWSDNTSCGGGLHFSPTPAQASAYNTEATRFLAVGVQLTDLRPIPGGTAKCKAPRVVRPCVEVDIDGNPTEQKATP